MFEDILEDMRKRDRIDSTRELAPLQAAPDAYVLNNTSMTVEEELQEVLQIIDSGQGSS
jgi:cytidylate kinase